MIRRLVLPALVCALPAWATTDSLHQLLRALPEDTSRLPVLQALYQADLHQRPDLALPYAEAYRTLADREGTPRQQAVARSQLGLVQLLRGRHADALPWFLDALERFQELDEPRSVAMLQGNVATVYRKVGRPRDALAELLRAQRMFEDLNDVFWSAGISEELGNTYAVLGLPDSANHWYERTVDIMERVGAADHVTETRLAQAGVWMDQGESRKAARLYEEALYTAEELGEQELIARVLTDLGKLRTATGDLREGAALLARARGIVEDGGFEAQRLEVYEALSEHHRRLGSADSAVWYLRLHLAWKDSLFTRESSARIAELQARYDLARKAAALEHHQVELAGKRTQLALALGLAGVLLAVVVALWRARRQRQRYLGRLEEQHERVKSALQEKELLLRELHHRVKNNLQTVSSLLRLQSRGDLEPAARTAIEEANARVKSMVLVHQDLYREGQLTAVEMDTYLHKLGAALLRGHGMQDRVELRSSVDPVRLDVDSAVPIGLIVNELLTNALKHAFPDGRSGVVEVRLKDEGDELLLTVQDDGVGLVEVADRDGSMEHGVSLVGTFAGSLDARWDMQGGDGTTVTLRMRNFVRA